MYGGPVLGDKVRDHCHITGKLRGAAHNRCNRRYRLTKNIPVVFHNLGGYDAHFLVLSMSHSNRQIGVIPNNFERYMTVSWGKLRFIDSYQFMSSSLDRLVFNLPKEDFRSVDSEFPKSQREIVKKKGIFPYEYLDSYKRFRED
jgi:hypothetical protein